jgi:hypothetical protein
MLHHHEIDIKYTYSIVTMNKCTELRDLMWDTERFFLLRGTGLQPQTGTGSFHPSLSHSIEKLCHIS